MIYEINVENIKCGGCAHSIKTGLKAVEGVKAVEVDIPNGNVRVEAGGNCSLETILATLKSMGYPERSKGSGLANATSIKSSIA